MVKKIISFLKNDVWSLRLKKLPKRKSFLIKQLRVILLSFRGFNEDKCKLRASSLTFYSLLSIVPVFAMAFGVAKGFGFEKILEEQIRTRFAAQQEVVNRVIDFSQSLLQNTRGGLIAGIGVVILFWAVMRVLSYIEKSFNDIWGVKKHRGLSRKFSDYLSIMLIAPIVFIVASSVNVFLASQIGLITDKIALIGFFSPVVTFFVKLIPYFFLWFLFSFIYIFMPNTKVNFKNGLIAGILAGSTYQIVQWAYINFQVGVSKFNTIYGSFAALPLFLLWLQISWFIVLFGAEVSFALQNVDTYEFEPDCLKVSNYFKKLVALRIVNILSVDFAKGKPPLTAGQLSHVLDAPIRLVREIVYSLLSSEVIIETKLNEEDEFGGYHPARDINSLTIYEVLKMLEAKGSANIPIAETEEFARLKEKLSSFCELVKNSPENKLLKDI